MHRSLGEHLARAADFYRDKLFASPRAVAYLKSRGVRGDIAGRYRLGYAPTGFQSLREVFPDYHAPVLQMAGLVAERATGRRFDRFRDRIMFPILDVGGRVIGFGGRTLEGDGPKYLNSPETELFQKGRVLFGLAQAAEAIVSTGSVVVVEGYLDVVSLAQHGVKNVVATLGTATTSQHIEQLLSLARRVVFCFDGDVAGQRAAARALDACLPYVTDSVSISFLFLPGAHDPDSFVRAEGVDVFQDLVAGAASLESYLLTNALQGSSLAHAEGRARLVSLVTPGLQKIDAPALLCRVLVALSRLSHFTVDELIELCGLEKNLCRTIDRQ